MKKWISLLLLAVGLPAGAQVSLSLDACREMALSGDVQMRNASLDVLSARAQRQEARWRYFPTVQVSALGFKTFDPLLDISYKDIIGNEENAVALFPYIDNAAALLGISTRFQALSDGWGAMAVLTQPVFAGGRIVTGNRLASLGVEAAVLRKSVTERDRLTEVTSKYWRVVGLEEKAGILEEALALAASLEKDVSSAVEAGLAVDTDLRQVQTRHQELSVQQVRLRSGIRLARMDLFDAVGVAYTPYESMACDSIPFVDAIALTDRLEVLEAPGAWQVPEEEVLEGVSEARLLEMQVRAKELERKMALGEALPEIGVGASYGYARYIGDGRFNGGVFASVRIPLTGWGPTSRKVQRLGYEVQKAENDRDYLTGQLLLRARQLWVELEAAWEELQAVSGAGALAEDLYERARADYAAGLVTASDLLRARTELRTAQGNTLDVRIAYAEALSAYRSFVGR